MKNVTIEFDNATLKVERERLLKDMTEEDVYWCFGAEITLCDGSGELYIETPIFYFTDKLLELASLEPPIERTVSDYYDSYRLQIFYTDAELNIFDEYSGSKVKLAFRHFFKGYEKAFQSAVDKLLSNNHRLSKCSSFENVLQKLSEGLKSLH